MYVGNRKDVGKVWQYSAVDSASSFAVARVVAGEKPAAAAGRFLEHDVVPVSTARSPTRRLRDLARLR